MINTSDAQCAKCRRWVQAADCGQCANDHFICRKCRTVQYYAYRSQTTSCPVCQTDLRAPTGRSRRPTLTGELFKLSWKLTFWWWGYLFRNPDLAVIAITWCLTLLLFMNSGRLQPRLGVLALIIGYPIDWAVETTLASLAPLLTLMFIRRKRSKLGVIAGWKEALKGDRKPVWVIFAATGLLMLFHLFMVK